MKKRTLNQTWILCLRMWQWIKKVWTPDGPSVHDLKSQWLKNNGFTESIDANCFFCDYNHQLEKDGCWSCPGRLVTSSFSCDSATYDYETKPVAFHKELLRLNRIRKAKKWKLMKSKWNHLCVTNPALVVLTVASGVGSSRSDGALSCGALR